MSRCNYYILRDSFAAVWLIYFTIIVISIMKCSIHTSAVHVIKGRTNTYFIHLWECGITSVFTKLHFIAFNVASVAYPSAPSAPNDFHRPFLCSWEANSSCTQVSGEGDAVQVRIPVAFTTVALALQTKAIHNFSSLLSSGHLSKPLNSF